MKDKLPKIDSLNETEISPKKDNLEKNFHAVKAQLIVVRERWNTLEGFLKNNLNEYVAFYSGNSDLNKVLNLADKEKAFAKLKVSYQKIQKSYQVYGIKFANITAELTNIYNPKIEYKED